MKLERIKTYRRFTELKEQWNELLDRSGQKNPFLSHQWFDAWWQSFGSGCEMEILFFTGNDDFPAGIAPMMIDGQALKFMANHEVTDYCDFISCSGIRREFFGRLGDYFLDNGMKYPRMEFINIPENSRTLLEISRWAGENGMECEMEKGETVPVLSLPESYEMFLQGMGRKNRHELRRKIRRLEGLDKIRLEQITEAEKSEPAVKEFISLHRKSDPHKREFWNRQGMTVFFEKLTSLYLKEQWAEFHLLFADTSLIAALLVFLNENTSFFYNVAYDKNYASYSPGFFLFDHAIKRAISQNRSFVNFLRGREKYKYFFGAQDSKIYNLKLTRSTEKR
jgi:CelD/BcsL family acetyltransferase involved in cellulose biosynthesis